MSGKVLIVDDDIDSLRLISLMLQRHGYDVTTASVGHQGIYKALKEIPDLIILDVMMPDMDGYEVCRRLRADPATQAIPIIMFTAKTLVDDKVAGFEAGADDYLTKPTHPAELATRVKAILQRSARHRHPIGGERGIAIGVIGVKGGIGTTTVALNLAAAFKFMGQNPLVADFRLGQGSLGLFLGLSGSCGMTNLLGKPISEIRESVEQEVITHTTGIRALLSSTAPREALLPVPAEAALTIVHELQSIGNPLVLDLGSGYSPLVNRLQSEIDRLVVLVEPAGVNLSLATELLRELSKIGRERISVAVVTLNNMAPRHLAWHELEHFLEHEICAFISAEPELALAAEEVGMPIVNFQPDSALSGQINKLAEQLQLAVGIG